MSEECLVCKAPLEYLEAPEPMECWLCHTVQQSRTRCVDGHFVCDACHTKGLDAVAGVCLAQASDDPVEVLEQLMDQPFCHMHGPEHHSMVGAALLTAYRNAGGGIDLEPALAEMLRRGSEVPGGACGYWGACGACISVGMFTSIVTGATPLSQGEWGLGNLATARALEAVGAVGGPRCCKRDSYLAVMAGVDFAAEHLGVQMRRTVPVCTRAEQNRQCIGTRCPFSPAS